MKNLKKVLALGLALVMLMGMFTVVSAAEDKMVASDLTDWNTVQHKDAVSLMVDLGIINGFPADDGTASFEPTASITRGQWAKMVYYAATGTDNADAYLGTASSLGDISGHWAEAYVNYLFANSLISGDNLGNYNPEANVTVAEASKMMLTTLGYDAVDKQYQGTSAWAGNVIRDAKRNGLLDNLDSDMTAMVPLTRENAAELVLNTLNANMVTKENGRDNGEAYVVKYEYAQTLGYDVFDLVKVTATVDSIDSDGYANFKGTVVAPEDANGNTWDQVTASLNRKIKATSDMVGTDVNVYVRANGFKWSKDTGEITTNGTFVSTISTSVAKADTTPVKTINSGVVWKNLTSRSSSDYVASAFAKDCAFYLNGKSVDATLTVGQDGTVTGGYPTEVVSAAARRGTVVEFYTNTDGEISTVKAYLYEFSQVDGGDATTKTLSDGTVQVRVPGVIPGWVDSDKVSGWQGLVDQDVVLVYRTDLGNTTFSYTIEKAEKVTGNVSTFYSGGEISVGGTRYKGSEQNGTGTFGDVTCSTIVDATNNANMAAEFGDWLNNGYDLETEYDFYLDKAGAIGIGIQLTDSVDASKVCLVIEADYDTNGMGTTGWVKANLLFADGSTEIVDISRLDGNYVAKTADDKKIDYKTAYNTLKANYRTKFYSYRTSSSGYELTSLVSDKKFENEKSETGAFEVLKQSDFSQGDFPLTANNSTNFIVGKRNQNTDEMTYSVYKGFRNVPEMDATMITAIAADDTTGKTDTVARYVYMETGSFKDDVPEGFIFITDNNVQIDSSMADDEVYLVNIIDTDGSKTTMRVTASLADAIKDDSMTYNGTRSHVGKFWAVSEIDENGVVSVLSNELDTADQAVSTASLTGLGDGVIAFDNGESWDYDDATVFVFVDWGWEDNVKSDSNHPGQLDENEDDVVMKDYGTFRPAGFFNANDISDVATDAKTYKDVQAAVILPDNRETTADYVYVIRTMW